MNALVVLRIIFNQELQARTGWRVADNAPDASRRLVELVVLPIRLDVNASRGTGQAGSRDRDNATVETGRSGRARFAGQIYSPKEQGRHRAKPESVLRPCLIQ